MLNFDKALLAIVATIVLMLLAMAATAHQAGSGWTYDMECCHDTDCAVATRVQHLDDGSWRVTTKYGTFVYPGNFPKRVSPDGLTHACATPMKLYCLYVGVDT